jgi:hypothetical protein
MNPFDYLNSINQSKTNLMRDTNNDALAESEYNAFVVNRGLSYFQDTIFVSNEMNRYTHLDKKLQYEFLLNIIRPRKRFSKWFKKEQNDDVEAVKEYYGYSNAKALQALSVLSECEIKKIRENLRKGE